jgi:hypothetical protein
MLKITLRRHPLPLELKPGVTLPIPCRKCGKISKVALMSGKSELRCEDCDRTTEIAARQDPSGWTVKTRLIPRSVERR